MVTALNLATELHSGTKSLFPALSQGMGPLVRIAYVPPLASAHWKQEGQNQSCSQFTPQQQQGLVEYFSPRRSQPHSVRQRGTSASLQIGLRC